MKGERKEEERSSRHAVEPLVPDSCLRLTTEYQLRYIIHVTPFWVNLATL
jgi:hypothetical protein